MMSLSQSTGINFLIVKRGQHLKHLTVLTVMFVPKRKRLKIMRKCVKRSASESFNQLDLKSLIELFMKKKQTKYTSPLVMSMQNYLTKAALCVEMEFKDSEEKL